MLQFQWRGGRYVANQCSDDVLRLRAWGLPGGRVLSRVFCQRPVGDGSYSAWLNNPPAVLGINYVPGPARLDLLWKETARLRSSIHIAPISSRQRGISIRRVSQIQVPLLAAAYRVGAQVRDAAKLHRLQGPVSFGCEDRTEKPQVKDRQCRSLDRRE